MAWEIAKYFKLDGDEVKMWMGKDAEGRRIYCVAARGDLYEPSGGLYSQKAAQEEYLQGKKMQE